MTRKISPQPSCADPFDPDSISLATALVGIRQLAEPLGSSERLGLRDSLERISFRPIQSPMNVPASANSAMDGYAIAVDSLPASGVGEFSQIGTAYAGQPFTRVCGRGETVRIMTGALLPEGCDAVIMQEQVEVDEQGRVLIDSSHRSGENVRQAGEDVKNGETVLEAGVPSA